MCGGGQGGGIWCGAQPQQHLQCVKMAATHSSPTLPYIHPALFKTTQSSEFWVQFLSKEWVLRWKDVKQIGLQDYSDEKCEGGL